MKSLSSIFLAGLTLTVLVCATVSTWVLEPMKTKQKSAVISALEKPIKIRPMNTSCMPFTPKEVTYNWASSICEKKESGWIKLDGSPCDISKNIESSKTELMKPSLSRGDTVMNISNSIDDTKTATRAASLYVSKSCNNNI